MRADQDNKPMAQKKIKQMLDKIIFKMHAAIAALAPFTIISDKEWRNPELHYDATFDRGEVIISYRFIEIFVIF